MLALILKYIFKKQQLFLPHYFKKKYSEVFEHIKHDVKDIRGHSETVVNSGKSCWVNPNKAGL